jgi:hypothetical protein
MYSGLCILASPAYGAICKWMDESGVVQKEKFDKGF